ncbi:MAG: hypothetical protein U1E63_02125 [Burkholderiales bacterium]
MQFSFSTDETRKWFASTGVPYYLLGFSYTENVQFAAPLLKELNPRASRCMSSTLIDFLMTHGKLHPQSRFCMIATRVADTRTSSSGSPSIGEFQTMVPGVCGGRPAFFRSRIDGTWELEVPRQYGTQLQRPQPTARPAKQTNGTTSPHWVLEFPQELAGRSSLRNSNPRPSEATKRAEATAIASALGVTFIAPNLGDLKTFDGSHLDCPSAEKWSWSVLRRSGCDNS